MPRYGVEVVARVQTITTYYVEIDAEDAVEAEDRVTQLLSEAGAVHDLPAHAPGATVTLDIEDEGETTWKTGYVWEVIEKPDPRQGVLFAR